MAEKWPYQEIFYEVEKKATFEGRFFHALFMIGLFYRRGSLATRHAGKTLLSKRGTCQVTVLRFARKLTYGIMPKTGSIPMVEVLRLRAEITQEALAKKLGIRDHTWRNWIKGRTVPTFTVIQMKALCEALNCELSELPNDFSK